MYEESTQASSEFGTTLRESHASLFAVLEDLLFDETSAPARLQRIWRGVEAALHSHLTTEEELLIPRFEQARPADAARIRGEHRQLREQLSALDAGFARELVDHEVIARLLGILRVSAASKERGLYAWAEHALRPRDKARMVDRVRANGLARAPGSATPA